MLTIAGFDPSGGAGVLADIKTFEQNKLMGLAVTTAITFQNEDIYLSEQWLDFENIKRQLDPLFDKYSIDFVKIGLIQDINTLNLIVDYLLLKNTKIKIVLDPILKATGSVEHFHKNIKMSLFQDICAKLFMITPNWEELQKLFADKTPLDSAKFLSNFCHVYLKGGHRIDKKGYDTLYIKGVDKKCSFRPKLNEVLYPKHGSGCVLSSAIVSNLANGFSLHKSCLRAKEYTEYVLKSNITKLGWHKR